ncbi:MAG: MFS transporter [Bacillota bacterium]|nr:MFS transporter [Bacillota bacterium]
MINRTGQLILVAAGVTFEASNTFLFGYFMQNIQADFAITPLQTTLMGFLPLIFASLGGLGFGYFSDQSGRKKGFIFCLCGSVVSMLLVAASITPAMFIVGRLISGFTLAGTLTTGATLINESWQYRYLGRVSSVVQSGFSFSHVLISIALIVLPLTLTWRTAYYSLAAFQFIILVFSYHFVHESPRWLNEKTIVTSGKKEFLFTKNYRTKIILTSILAFIGFVSGNSSQVWLPSFYRSLNITPFLLPYITLIVFIIGTAGYLGYGFISDRFGRKPTFILFLGSAALFSASLSLFTPSPTPTVLFIVLATAAGAMLAFSIGFFSGYTSLMSEYFPTIIRGTAIGFCFNIGRVGNGIGPVIIGSLSERFGIGPAYLFNTLMLLIGIIIVLLLPKPKDTMSADDHLLAGEVKK